MSHVQKTKLQFTVNRLWVMALTGMSEEVLAQMQYEAGIEYLREYLRLDDATAHAFEMSRTWWNWWANQWALQDANIFLPGAMQSDECLAGLYLRVHSLWFINAHPGCDLMDASYNEMTKQLYAELKRP